MRFPIPLPKAVKYQWVSDPKMATTTTSTTVKASYIIASSSRSLQQLASLKNRASSPTRNGSSLMIRKRTSKVDIQIAPRFATWNALTLNGVGCQVHLANELDKYKIAAVGTIEVRLPGHEQRVVNGAITIHCGSSTSPLLSLTTSLRRLTFQFCPMSTQPFTNCVLVVHPVRVVYCQSY